jgi:hypothetical protein
VGSTNANNPLRLRHRRWVYEGLDIPEGMALVRRESPKKRPPPPQLLVVGDEVAQAVGPPLTRLARDAGVAILVQGRPGLPAESWLEQGWIVSAVGRCLPDLLLLAFMSGQDPDTMDKLAVAAGCPALWLSPDPAEATKVVTPVHLPAAPDTMAPTALGYAAWAGRAWHVMSEMSNG